MIRVRVPLDLHAVAVGGSGAFALATPLRVRDLLEFAVREAIGSRAPHDKFSRSMHRTLAGLAAGDFTSTSTAAASPTPTRSSCAKGTADVRFFLTSAPPRAASPDVSSRSDSLLQRVIL